MALRRSAAPSDAVAMSALELIDDSVPMFTSVKELTSYSTYRAAIGELVGTCLFVFMVTGCPVFSAGGVSIGVTGIALNFGLSIATLAYCFGGVSGCHLNPAVTWAQTLARKTSIFQGVLHVACQLLGAIIGAALVASIGDSLKGMQGSILVDASKTLWQVTGGATNFVRLYDAAGSDVEANVAVGPAFVGEMLGTMLLVLVVMVIGDQERSSKDKHNAILGPLAAGLAVFIANITLIPITNCSINPARAFGPAVIFGGTPAVAGLSQTPWTYMWLFWLAPLAGATLATVIWQLAFTADHDGWVHCSRGPAHPAGLVKDWSPSARNIALEIAASPAASDSLDAAEVAVAA